MANFVTTGYNVVDMIREMDDEAFCKALHLVNSFSEGDVFDLLKADLRSLGRKYSHPTVVTILKAAEWASTVNYRNTFRG